MKTERRHELQANQLAELLTDVGEKTKPYAKVLLGLIVCALAIVCAYLYLSKQAESVEATSWDKAGQAVASNPPDTEALREIVKDYPNKPAAFWSQLVLADMNFNRGVAALFSQKSVGRDLLRTAEEDYQNVADHAVQPMLREHALFGVGRTQESLDKLSEARETYKLLLKDYAGGPYAARAQLRIDDLARPSTMKWYDWFEAVEPTPSNFGKGGLALPFDDKGTTGPSLPPLGPEFNLPLGDSKTPPPEPKPDLKTKPDDKTKPVDTTKPGDTAKPDDKSPPSEKTKPDDGAKTDQKPKAAEPKADNGKAEPPQPDVTKPPATPDDKSKPNAAPPEVPPAAAPKTDAGKADGSK